MKFWANFALDMYTKNRIPQVLNELGIGWNFACALFTPILIISTCFIKRISNILKKNHPTGGWTFFGQNSKKVFFLIKSWKKNIILNLGSRKLHYRFYKVFQILTKKCSSSGHFHTKLPSNAISSIQNSKKNFFATFDQKIIRLEFWSKSVQPPVTFI